MYVETHLCTSLCDLANGSGKVTNSSAKLVNITILGMYWDVCTSLAQNLKQVHTYRGDNKASSYFSIKPYQRVKHHRESTALLDCTLRVSYEL